MKKLLFYLLLCLTIAMSCSKDNNGKLRHDAMISIWPKGAVHTTKADAYLSNYEIVRQANTISWYNDALKMGFIRAFAPAQRDTINIRLLMWGTDIIDQQGDYVIDFIEGRDFVLRRSLTELPVKPIYDTIAYVPNSVILNAQKRIKTAYDANNYAAVYAAFDSVFTFIPITGSEWRGLKTRGKN